MPDADSPRIWSERFAAALAKSPWFRDGVEGDATRAEFWETWVRDALASGLTQPEVWSAWFGAALEASGRAQAAIAGILHMTTGNVSKWNTGKGGPPSRVEDVITVAHALGAPDAIAALYAAGMHATAELIRRETAIQPDDPMIARILGESALTEEQREAWIEEYLRRKAENVHYFELRIAEEQRKQRATRARRRTPHAPETSSGNGERAAL